MASFFESKQLLETLGNIKHPSLRDTVLSVFKEIKDDMPETSIDCFICIAQKYVDPYTSYCYSASTYYNSVKLWNDFNYKNGDVHLIISRVAY
jgi:hypothetical protein